MGIVFHMGMPFAQIANGSLTLCPSRHSDCFVAKRHSLEQVAKPFVMWRRFRRLLDEHMGSMNRAEKKPTSFAVSITSLNV